MSSYRKDIGANIRYERTIRNMSIDELAEMLHLSTAFIGLIERGQRGAKLSNLIRMTEIFGITINDLIYGRRSNELEIKEENEGASLATKKSTISTLLYDLDGDELDFVISNIRSLRILKSSRNAAEYADDEDDEFVEY